MPPKVINDQSESILAQFDIVRSLIDEKKFVDAKLAMLSLTLS